MKRPERGEKFTAKVDRISSSGNGIIDLSEGHINIGPVSEDSVGEEIEAKLIDKNFAKCLTEKFIQWNYDIEFERLKRKKSSKSNRRNTATFNTHSESSNKNLTFSVQVEFCEECGSIMHSSEDTWHCTSCGFEKQRRKPVPPLSSEKDPQPENYSSNSVEKQVEPKTQGFQLSNSVGDSEITRKPTKSTELAVLREKANSESVEEVPDDATISTQSKPEYTRSQAIVEYVKARADGYCEGCEEPAPFTSKTGEPYLHAHHIHELSSGGSDTPDTVIALCPNCHYQVHHGQDGEEYNRKLLERLESIEDNNRDL